jgi:EAL domain-containing protein (putative c-di-GMP-specific phosphodiesterase class I)
MLFRRLRKAVPKLDRVGVVVFLAATGLHVLVFVLIAFPAISNEVRHVRAGWVEAAKNDLVVLHVLGPPVLRPDATTARSGFSSVDRRRLEAALRQLGRTGGTKIVRMWSADGTGLYRSPADRARETAPSMARASRAAPWSLERAASGGSPAALVTYVPVHARGQLRGVLELDQPLAPVLADEAAQRRVVVLTLSVIGAVLWLGGLPISLRVAQLIAVAWGPRRRRLLRRLRRGIADGELEVHFQPKVDLASGKLDGVEALVRWRRDGVLVPPGAFLPAVERSPLIRPLTLHVLDAALAQAREWELAGEPIRVAVNLAPVSLTDSRIVEDVASALRRHGVEPARLTLELTETAVLDDEDASGATLVALAGLGVGLSVDDFGTGYSSLARISRHPFTELKIDRSFVMDLRNQERPMVATIVRLAKTLGLRVVAEGVEDEATLNALRALGCDVAQGYLLARPVPAADLPQAVTHLPALARTAADVRSLLDEVRESLELDAAFVAEFVDSDEIFRWTSGNSGAFELREGGRQALEDSYCSRLATGVFPNLFQDTRDDPRARDLPVTEERGIRSYIGVPLHRPDGTLYGTLCGLGGRPRPDLADDEIATLAAFGQRISPLLSSAHLAASTR